MRIGFDLDDTLNDNEGYAQAFWQNYITTNNLPYKVVNPNTDNLIEMFDWQKEVFFEAWDKAGEDYLMGHLLEKTQKMC